ncbi:hypothetical protein [Streptomyces sp. NPDC127098]|uniref:hypothetical protein n=1 Tax=Streptomyces sp. NPDC127098 TaxID=3347137 RepID=UPI003647512F
MSAPDPFTPVPVARRHAPADDRTVDLSAPRPGPRGGTGAAPAAPVPATPDLSTLPETTWDDDVEAPFALAPAQAGVHLGTGRDGRPVALPCPGPAGTRVAAVGESLFGRLIALRLLATGALVTAAARDPGPWQGIRRAAGDRLAFTEDPAAWPRHTPAPPAVDAGPQALVSDQRRAPSSALAAGPWRTVLHVTRNPPRGAAFWHHPDVLLALGADHADAVGRLLGAEAARLTSLLAPGEVVLFRVGTAEVLRPDIAPGEHEILTAGTS